MNAWAHAPWTRERRADQRHLINGIFLAHRTEVPGDAPPPPG
jgi:hypothetical protein